MASILGNSFDSLTLEGDAAGSQGMVLQDITRPGVDGKAYIQVGERPDTSVYMSRKGFSSAASRKSAMQSYRQAQGDVGQLVKEDGTTWRVVVVRVSVVKESRASVVVGYTGTYLLFARWELEVQE